MKGQESMGVMCQEPENEAYKCRPPLLADRDLASAVTFTVTLQLQSLDVSSKLVQPVFAPADECMEAVLRKKMRTIEI